MTHDSPLALPPEQVAAVNAGTGIVYAEDPSTPRRYALVESDVETTHSDESLRKVNSAGLAELDRGEGVEWNPDDFKRRLAERLISEKKSW